MKKLKFLALGAVALLMASCSQEEAAQPKDAANSNFSVKVTLPVEMKSRALSDGFSATELTVVVYDAKTQAYITTIDADFPDNSLSTTVNFELAYNKSYKMFFFAQSPESENVYAVNGPQKNVTVNYGNMTSENNIEDAYDCFYTLWTSPTITQNTPSSEITLYRFVAQVNWGTNDILKTAIANEDAFGKQGQYIRTNFVGDAYTQWSIFDENVVEESKTTVAFRGFQAPAATEAFPVQGTPAYQYVAMQYLLVDKNKNVYNFSLDINNSGNENDDAVIENFTIAVDNANAQQNFRTNIFGNLLSSDYSVTVTKWPNYWEPSYDYDYNN